MTIFYIKNTLFICEFKQSRERKMLRPKARPTISEQTINPFEVHDNSHLLLEKLASIDEKDLRCKFKNTNDPITLAFDTIGQSSLKSLAKDFVKDSFYDLVCFISDICK